MNILSSILISTVLNELNENLNERKELSENGKTKPDWIGHFRFYD